MARTLAKLQVTIWQSEDWRGLPTAAQWLYMVLLTQPRLSLAGCVDLTPTRWATLAPDATEGSVMHALEVLERGNYVAVDRSTGEVAIRTFTTHDLAAGTLNVNLVKGFWSAWSGIMSADLRHYVITNLPDRVWDWTDSDGTMVRTMVATMEAEHFRRSARLEPQFEPWSEPSASFSVSDSASVAAAKPVQTVDEKVTAAARLLAAAEVERRGSEVAIPEKYINSRLKQLTEQNVDRWRAMLDADPTTTPEQLIATKAATPARTSFDDATVAASEARYRLAEKVRNGEVCGTCRGTRQWLPDDSDVVAPCPECRP